MTAKKARTQAELDREIFDLVRDLKQARESLNLKDQRIADLEAQAKDLIAVLRSTAVEADDARHQLAVAQAVCEVHREQIEATIRVLGCP